MVPQAAGQGRDALTCPEMPGKTSQRDQGCLKQREGGNLIPTSLLAELQTLLHLFQAAVGAEPRGALSKCDLCPRSLGYRKGGPGSDSCPDGLKARG